MKLTAHTLRVKQTSAAQLLLAGLLTGLGLMWLWSGSEREDTLIDHFGNTLAAAVASQVIEPLIDRDLIHLGVLVNRTTELPEVLGASIHDLEGQRLALSGDVRRGRSFVQQVVHNGTTIGLIRIHLDGSVFDNGMSAGVIFLSLLWMVLVPVAVLALDQLSLPASLQWPRPVQKPLPGTDERPIPAEPDQEPQRWYLITVNLFNQLSLPPDQCQQELAAARESATRVAALYQGHLQDLPGTGLLLSFASSESSDRPFHVLCAAFTLSSLLAAIESRGRYRLGVHTLLLDADDEPAVLDEAVTDASVLSALARDNTIVISHALLAEVPYADRLVSEQMRHPLLEELATIGGGAHLARRLEDPHAEVVAQQVRELSYSNRSIASESTF